MAHLAGGIPSDAGDQPWGGFRTISWMGSGNDRAGVGRLGGAYDRFAFTHQGPSFTLGSVGFDGGVGRGAGELDRPFANRWGGGLPRFSHLAGFQLGR